MKRGGVLLDDFAYMSRAENDHGNARAVLEKESGFQQIAQFFGKNDELSPRNTDGTAVRASSRGIQTAPGGKGAPLAA